MEVRMDWRSFEFCRPARPVKLVTTHDRFSAPFEHLGEYDFTELVVETVPDAGSDEPAWIPMKLSDHPLLFREFGFVEVTPEACADFCNRFGFLQGRPLSAMTVEPDSEEKEPLLSFTECLTAMKPVVVMWDALNTRDGSCLGEMMTLNEQGQLQVISPDDDGELAPFLTLSQNEMRALGITAADRFDLGWKLLPLVVKEMLSIVPMLPDPEFRISDPETPYLALVPDDLISALCMQLLDVVFGRREYRQCEVCDTSFELHPDNARTNRRFCSDACRSKHYRSKTNKARALHQLGWTVEGICEELKTSADKVAIWIEKTPQQRRGAATEKKGQDS